MKTLILAIAFLSLLTTEASGAGYTAIGLDCEFWDSLEELGAENDLPKILFVRGFYEGLHLGGSPKKDEYYTQTDYGNLSKALDLFCSDYRNKKIWLVPALRIISMEIKGAEKSVIDKELRRLRALFSKPLN